MKTEQEFIAEGLSDDEVSMMDTAMKGGAVHEEPAPSPEPEPSGVDANRPQANQQEPVAKDDQPKMVDVRALQEARAAEREMRELIAREREERAKLEERTNQLLQRINGERDKPEIPNKDQDPLGYYEYELQALRKQNEEFQKTLQQQKEAASQQEAVQRTLDDAGKVLDQAIATSPDVKEAFEFSVNAARAELTRQGFYGAQLSSALTEHLYRYAAQAPRDPAQMAEYVRANGRYWGWTQAPQSAAAPQQQQPSVAELAERQERHMSLSAASGGEPPKQLDAKALASMSDDQFKEFMSTAAGRKHMESIMGA